MTRGACEFITPLTLQTLSGSPVAMDLLDADEESAMGHITLARWADWVLIAPASANTMARIVQGRTEDLLSALCLATEAPIALAPAMNNKMWTHKATQQNLAVLSGRGNYILGPASGEQACGDEGEGRLLEPEQIIALLSQLMVPKRLVGNRVVVTAGPTHEPIDPVRYIGNRSSGKMGFELACAAAEAGAEVILITGPVHLTTPSAVCRIDVETAQQMYDAVMDISDADIVIGCAAVADYRPAEYQDKKIKKADSECSSLALIKNHDILAAVSQRKEQPFVVGFAAETDNLAEYAKDKMKAKNLDMVAANLIGKDMVFGSDMNALQVFWSEGEQTMATAFKSHLARELMTLIIERYDAKNSIKNT